MLLYTNSVSPVTMAWDGKSDDRTDLKLLKSYIKIIHILTSGQDTIRSFWSPWDNASELPRVLTLLFVTFNSFCVFDLTEQLLKELFFHAWQFCFVTILKFPVNRDIVICMNPFQESEVWCFIAGAVFYCIVLASVIIHLSKEIVNGMLCCCQS